MVPNPRVYAGWLWTGQTVDSKWRFRKYVPENGKWTVADVDASLSGKALQAALDAAAPAAATSVAADPAKAAPAAPSASS